MRIQALAGSHDRAAFDCGRVELNEWLQRVARQHQQKGISKTFVATLDDTPQLICGYYALTVTEVDASALSDTRRKKLPRTIPGIRLGGLAVALPYQGKRLGELLLVDAIERTRVVQAHAGVVGLFVDAIDTHAARFYVRYGFEALTDDPLRLFLPVV